MDSNVVKAIFYLVFATMAFQGLLGSMYKNFWFAKSRRSKKHYVGRHATRWGLIFFVGFSILPVVLIIEEIKNKILNNFLLSIYFLLTLAALAIAFYARKHGFYKIA